MNVTINLYWFLFILLGPPSLYIFLIVVEINLLSQWKKHLDENQKLQSELEQSLAVQKQHEDWLIRECQDFRMGVKIRNDADNPNSTLC
jgi:hypothetical protein